MAIIKGQIHPSNNVNDTIYPETSVDQVKDLAIYKHSIEVICIPNGTNHLVINYDIYSYDSTPLNTTNVREDIYYNGICTVFDTNTPKSYDILGICGKFTFYRNLANKKLFVNIFRVQDDTEFTVDTITDTVTNIFTEPITE